MNRCTKIECCCKCTNHKLGFICKIPKIISKNTYYITFHDNCELFISKTYITEYNNKYSN